MSTKPTDERMQKQGKELEEESLRLTQFALDAASVGVFWIAPPGTFTCANQAACDLLGYTREEILAMAVWDIDPGFAPDKRQAFWERLKKDKVRIFETRHRTRRNQVVPVEVTSHYLYYHGQECEFALVRDISKRKRIQRRIRLLSQQLIRAQEGERQLISRELHDRVAQDLSAAKITSDRLINCLETARPEEKALLVELSRTLEKTIMVVRDLSYDLRPPELDDIGLIQTIYEYCQDFSARRNIVVDFRSAGLTDLELDSEMEINLYRLVQEGLTNIRKHAEATQITIRLVAAFPNIILRIIDNGKGFDVRSRLATAVEEKRMGLRSMEERVNLLGGAMKIQSQPEKGTHLAITIPYVERNADGTEDSLDR